MTELEKRLQEKAAAEQAALIERLQRHKPTRSPKPPPQRGKNAELLEKVLAAVEADLDPESQGPDPQALFGAACIHTLLKIQITSIDTWLQVFNAADPLPEELLQCAFDILGKPEDGIPRNRTGLLWKLESHFEARYTEANQILQRAFPDISLPELTTFPKGDSAQWTSIFAAWRKVRSRLDPYPDQFTFEQFCETLNFLNESIANAFPSATQDPQPQDADHTEWLDLEAAQSRVIKKVGITGEDQVLHKRATDWINQRTVGRGNPGDRRKRHIRDNGKQGKARRIEPGSLDTAILEAQSNDSPKTRTFDGEDPNASLEELKRQNRRA